MGAMSEVMPLKFLERGEIRTITAEMEYETWQEKLDSLRSGQKEGFRYVLRLPRVNEVACVKKYGPYYDKLQTYHDFVKTLAKRLGVETSHASNSDYMFKEKDDAEKLKAALIEKQEKAEFEFEAIENS